MIKRLTSITVFMLALMVMQDTAGADTIRPVAIAPEAGVEVFTQEVAQRNLNRDLFSNPYASVVIATVDIYDGFPYLEARNFQIVTDPGWNRLLMGETGTGLKAFDGSGTSFGPLSKPHGIALGSQGDVYVADTGNNRILVLKAITEFDDIRLEVVTAITDVAQPYDVAFSDGGTPEHFDDDRLYVAESGKNRVVSYSLLPTGPKVLAAVGDLGSGSGHFAGPMALAIGHEDGVTTDRIYVADAHNRRVVKLTDNGDGLVWEGAADHGFDVVTSMDTDHWGNLFLAGPNQGLAKFSPDLEPLVEINDQQTRPRDFHVVFATVTDHTKGTTTRSGQAKGILLSDWSAKSGIGLMDLGVELKGLEVSTGDAIEAGVLLTDRARVSARIVDPATGQVMARRDSEIHDAGNLSLTFEEDDFLVNLKSDSYLLEVDAVSLYKDAATARVETSFSTEATAYSTTGRPLLLGNSPNPFRGATTIQFVVPDGAPQSTVVRIYDVQGRHISTLVDQTIAPGLVSVPWDGRDSAGRAMGAGIYFYKVLIGSESLVSRMILVR